MATIHALADRKPNKKGIYPIVFRVTENRKSIFIYSGQYTELRHWDKKKERVKKSHPNSVRLNHYIHAKIIELNDLILQIQSH